MPKLVLANPHSRAMTARPDDLPPIPRRGCDIEAARMLWSLAADDIAVIPGPIDKGFLNYLADLLGLSGAVPAVLSMQDYRGIKWYPHDNAELVAEVRNLLDASGFHRRDWTVASYIRDRDVAHWERLLGLDTDAAPYAQDLASLVNSKAVFRALALAAGTPVPEGYAVDAGPELVDTVLELIGRTGSVIVKQDQNSGGLGNTLITTDADLTGFGAAQVLRLDGDLAADLPRALHDHDLVLGDSLDLPRGMAPAKFIVEVYQPDSRSLSSELCIPAAGAPVLRNYGEMRMEPRWSGFVLPPQDLPATVHAQFCADSQQIALSAQRLGYHGLINIDAIVGADHRLTYTEFNGRAGGVTNIDTIGRRLIGEDYLHHRVLLTRNGLRVPRITEFAEHLVRAGLHFDAARGCGIVVGTDDPVTGAIEYVAIGRDRAEAERLEQQLETLAADIAGND
ncbi:peptide ligase PGM1-related protein [Nocardia sp. NPDC051756]|uniref:preATP grasp domain-containing protein n=1 Tax=Nocardia sp. NPDC051756 TaxID=3154751 RepID=UPI00343CDAA4